MEENKVIIEQLDPRNFEFQDYISSDENLIASSDLDTVFSENTDYIEYCIYDESNNKIYPFNSAVQLSSFKILKGDVVLNPKNDLESLDYNNSTYSILYNFYRKRLSSSITDNYYIKEISSDRTEIRLDSNTISNENLITSTREFINYRNSQPYFVDFLLNFGNNQTIIANNIRLEDEDTDDPTILIKLYEPLPSNFNLKTILWVVEEISTPQMYKVKFPFSLIDEEEENFISGPNFNLSIKDESGVAGQSYSFNSLVNSNITSSVNQLESLLSSSNVNINIDYNNYSDFIYFSSAKTRLENFAYKVGLIEEYTAQISASLGKITGDTTNSSAYSASKASYEAQIKDIITNFDGYDYFLYYNSGSLNSWPKKNDSPPYILYSSTSSEAKTWLGSADPDNDYYGGQALSASNYDDENQNYLYWSIPEYLRDDPDNSQYTLFVDMVAQQYDNTWLYTKDLTNKFNTDNRLEYGISKDLVADAIRDFGIKLYSNNFNTDDLYTAFLGLTPSGSLFPFPNISETLPAPSGDEFINTKISSSNAPTPLNDVNKKIYKRIYHSLPYLLKSKGTIGGLKALLTSYGIPDTILRINEFGGKDRLQASNWNLQQKVFNYAFDTEGKYIVSSSFDPNTNFGGYDSPRTVQLRFKSRGIPSTDHYSQSLYHVELERSALVLEYTGSGLDSGSYSGSIANPENHYATLKFIPDSTSPEISASLYLPFFDGGWWSIQTTVDTTNSASLFAANRIENKLGFTGSDSINGFTSGYYFDATEAYFPTDGSTLSIGGKTYELFSGSYQEIRYYNSIVNTQSFHDYVMNPYSFEGNTIDGVVDELIFRADLGTVLNTGSTTSIHPKVTGSSTYTTESFASDSNFYVSSSNFVINREDIYQDQVVSGIKNRVTDKVNIIDNNIPTGNTLSPIQTLEQKSFVTSSYTKNVDYLEVAFSPQDQINDDINAQMGYFNIGEYIGDPRQISQSSVNYPDLDTLRDGYFNKYISSYNLVDFVRLIKFFDNSLFKMIKDFTPAKTSLSSGVVVKQHILERNRVSPPQVSYSDVTYSGSIKPQSRNYNTGSGDVGQYEFTSGSSIYTFKGGTGGSFEKFNGLDTSPSASDYGLNNKFSLTQSYEEYKEGKLGRELITTFDQKEFYDGEFSGSNIVAATQSLNPGCIVYLKNPDKPLNYFPYFYSDPEEDVVFGTTRALDWQERLNVPLNGQAWFYSKLNPQTFEDEVKFIKIAAVDANGNEVRDFLLGAETIQFEFAGRTDENGVEIAAGGIKTYHVDGVQIFAEFALVRVKQLVGDYTYASDDNGGTENWSLRAYGDYTASLDESMAGTDYNAQGTFRALTNFQRQFFRYYNGGGDIDNPSIVGDPLNLFDSGSEDLTETSLLNNQTGYDWGTYRLARTPNIPLVVSASIEYSASGNEINQELDTSGVYHTGSFYGANSTNQTVGIIKRGYNGINISSQGYDTAAEAEEVAATVNVYFTGSYGSTPTAPILANFNAIQSPGGGTLYLSPDTFGNILNGNNKFYRIGDNHTAQVNAFGRLTNLNLFQNSGNPTPVKNNFGFSGSFSLPSIDVSQITMDTTYYNNSINQNIPAYSGSGKDSGGAPQLNVDTTQVGDSSGTASLYWDHSEFQLGGTAPPPLTPTFETAPFSGSATNTDNANFAESGTGIITPDITYATFDDPDRDGVFRFRNYDFQVAQIDSTGFNLVTPYLCKLIIKFDVTFATNYTLGNAPRVCIQKKSNQNSQGFITLSNSTVTANSSGRATNGPGRIVDELPGVFGAVQRYRLAIVGKPGEDYDYHIDNFQVDIQYERPLDSLGHSTTENFTSLKTKKGTSNSDNNKAFPLTRVSTYAEAETTTYIYITGSDGTNNEPDLNPKQPVARSIGVRGPVTASSNIVFPDGIIDKIYRTSSIQYSTRTITPNSQSTYPYKFSTSTDTDTFTAGSVKFNNSSLEDATKFSIAITDTSGINHTYQNITAFKIRGSFPGDIITINNAVYDTFDSGLYKFDFTAGNVTASGVFANQENIRVFTSIGNNIQYINPNYIGNGEAEYSSSISMIEFFDYPEGLTFPVKQNTDPKDSSGGTLSTVSSSNGESLYPTVNSSQSMFFPLYEFHNVTGSLVALDKGTEILPKSNNTYPKIFLTNSIDTTSTGYDLTGSIEIWKGDRDNLSSVGDVVFSEDFIVPLSSSTDTINVSGSIGRGTNTFKYNDTYRMAISVNKGIGSFLTITNYTMSLFPSESKFATITENFSLYSEAEYGTETYGGNAVVTSPGYNKFSPPTNTPVILSSYYGEGVLPFAIMLDCQPLINNYNLQRKSSYLMDIDYNPSEGANISTTGTTSGGNNVITIDDANITASIVEGQTVQYFDNQFTGPVKVTGISGFDVFVNKNSNSNSGVNQQIRFTTPSFGSLRPVNFQQILSGSAVRADIPDSNYTQTSWVNMRYGGVKTISSNYNYWSPTDKNTYGQLPVIEIRNAFFGYFDSIKNLYPLYNDATLSNVSYFIDEQGNALPPSLQAGFSKAIVEKAFSPGDEITFTFTSGSTELNDMDPTAEIIRVGEKPFPVLYTQNGGQSYSRNLTFSGSGRLSLYDNGDGNSFNAYTFQAQGTASWQDERTIPTPATTTTDPVYIYQYLNPHVSSSQLSDYTEFRNVYTQSASGSIAYGLDPSSNDDLSNPQFLSFETSFATSFLYEGYRRRKNDGDELKIQVIMEVTGSDLTPRNEKFGLEDITLKVHKLGGKALDLGSILGEGKGTNRHELARFITVTPITVGRRGKKQTTAYRKKYNTDVGFNTLTNSYIVSIENPALERFMIDRGAYVHGQGDVQKKGDITALEWIVKGNSGEYVPKKQDNIKFKLGLSMLKSVKKESNTFFPSQYDGPVFPTKITAVGAKDHLLDNANTGSAPFWVFTGSAGGGTYTDVIDQSILVMSSSIINEAYGGGYYQSPLTYTPGRSDYFPDGNEPKGTQIGRVQSEVILQEGDEIRFQNSELYTYKIIKVTPPQENIEASASIDIPRLKIQLDRAVDGAINKDFFLIRRFKESPRSFILNQEFPYDSVQSASMGSGIIYPEFPTQQLEVSSSQIVTDLVSKGIII